MSGGFFRWRSRGEAPRVCVVAGDDAAPEVVLPTLDLLRALAPEPHYTLAASGGVGQVGLPAETRAAIDGADCTLFGASGGPSRPVLWYLRWGKLTRVNIRPVRWSPGYRSPLKEPANVDYVIVRDNLEGLYPPREGQIAELETLTSRDSWWLPVPFEEPGAYALRVYTDGQMEHLARAACALAVSRQAAGYPGRVTLGAKYSLLPQTDGRLREIVREEVARHPELEYREYLIDDLARRLIAEPETLDVVVLSNEHGDILADAASGTIGGLGLSPSGCYGENYAYFEPVHGSAPDLQGQGIINPTAMLLSGALLLAYLGYEAQALRLEAMVARVYREGRVLPRDQGGKAGTKDFVAEVSRYCLG